MYCGPANGMYIDQTNTAPYLILERAVEPGIVPEAGADPHQSQTLATTDADAIGDALFHFVTEAARMRHGPGRRPRCH